MIGPSGFSADYINLSPTGEEMVFNPQWGKIRNTIDRELVMKRVNIPISDEILDSLKVGDNILLNGTVYSARDQAHKRLVDLIDAGKDLPFPLKGSVIYYVGPSPSKPGEIIGSAGPTTSYRMDSFTPKLLELGVKATIGKGQRSKAVREAMVKYHAIYLAAIGGAAALLAQRITRNEIIAFAELGPEAVRRMEVSDFPVTVVNDIHGGDLYDLGVSQFGEIHKHA